MTAKRQIESSINSGTMLDGTGGHVTPSSKVGKGPSIWRSLLLMPPP